MRTFWSRPVRIGYAGIMHRSMQEYVVNYGWTYVPSLLISHWCQWSHTYQVVVYLVVGETFFLPVPTPYFPHTSRLEVVVLTPFQIFHFFFSSQVSYAWFTHKVMHTFLSQPVRIRYAGITHRSMQGVRGQLWVTQCVLTTHLPVTSVVSYVSGSVVLGGRRKFFFTSTYPPYYPLFSPYK